MTSTPAALVYRDYETDGVPGSGTHEPVKSEIRALFAGVFANSPRAVVAPYTVDATSDPGTTLGVTGTGTVSFGAAAGYKASHFNIIINMGSSGVLISPTGATPIRLYPGQWCMVSNFSGAWLVSPQQRYRTAGFAPSLYQNSAAADDTGDGFVSTPKKTIGAAMAALYQDFDFTGNVPNLIPFGATTESVTVAGQFVGIHYLIFAPANLGDSTWHAGGSGFCLLTGDNAQMILRNFKFDKGSNANASLLNGHQWGTCDMDNCDFGDAGPSGGHMQADHGGFVFNLGAYGISGGAGIHLQMGGGCTFSQQGSTVVTITNTPTITIFYRLSGSGCNGSFGGGVTYSGAVAAGCTQYDVNFNASLSLSGAVPPGSVAGSHSNGGVVV